mgnify:CR=1 FL=1
MTGFNLLDLIVLAILLVTVIQGFRKGFFRILINLTGVLAAFLAALYFRSGVTAWLLSSTEFFGTLEERIFIKLTDQFSTQASAGWVPSGAIAKALTLPEVMTAGQSAADVVNRALFGELSKDLANALTQGFAFVIVFLAVMLALLVLGILTSAIAELPLLKQANKLAGLVLGGLLGLINVWIFMMVITFFIPFTGSDWLINSLNTSRVAINFYNHNLLLYLLYYFVRT